MFGECEHREGKCMRPFNIQEVKTNLEKALKGQLLVTRYDKPATLIGLYPENEPIHRVAYIVAGCVSSCSELGHVQSNGAPDIFDLFLADPPKVKRVKWVGLYASFGRDAVITLTADTEDGLKGLMLGSTWKLASAQRIEWEEDAP
jgi:hypothetical protein